MQTDIICKLKAAQPFIYKVKGNYYCMGCSVFYECNDEEIEAFDKLQESFNAIMLLSYDIEIRDTEDLCERYISIFEKHKKYAYDSTKKVDADVKIEELITKLNELEVIDVKEQIDNREKIVKYKNHYLLNKSIRDS